MKKETAVPINEKISSGFLPYLSESLPITGVAIKEHSAKVEKRRPF
jgi:hypothetical protein